MFDENYTLKNNQKNSAADNSSDRLAHELKAFI